MKSTKVIWTQIELIGERWTLLATEEGVCRILFPHERLEDMEPWLRKHAPNCKLERNDAVFERFGIVQRLAAYGRGERVSFSDIPLVLWGTPFQRSVWTALSRIPQGETRSYADIAAGCGSPQAVRAVGAANGANPLPIVLPCHRVVGTNRKLTGYRGGLKRKAALLEREGAADVRPGGHERFSF